MKRFLTDQDKAEMSNAVTGHAVGQTISVQDVSPFKHELSVIVSHGNKINLASMENANFTANGDGSYTFTKTASGRASGHSECSLPAGSSATLSVDRWEGTVTGNLLFQVTYADGVTATLANLSAGKLIDTRILSKDVIRARVMLNSTEADGSFVKLTGLRFVNNSAASVETELVYNGEAYPAESDGVVLGLISTCPEIEMSVPVGYEIEVEYIRDADKAIKDLEARIDALETAIKTT